VSFLAQENERQVRDNYQEFIELILGVLGSPPNTILWRASEAVHRARWIEQLIYAKKIYISQ
jgi:hypothetical protein